MNIIKKLILKKQELNKSFRTTILNLTTIKKKYKIQTTNQESFFNTSFEIKNNAKIVASFKMCQFPGCCGIAILYNVEVYSEYQRKGIGTQIFQLAEEMAIREGYTRLICTDINKSPSRIILERNDWKDIDSFVNKRTNNKVFITIKDLRDE